MSNSALVFALSALKKANTANERIDALPLPMVFKGSLGTGGTISTLPTASSENEGYVYIVITDGTYAGQSAKAGDTFVSDGSTWVLVPSADESSVIDDSVTSTALTWSSKKISDECKIKSFTYTGTGTNPNVIKFPETPKMVLLIEGYRSSDHTSWENIQGFKWGKSVASFYYQVALNLGGVTFRPITLDYDDNDNELTITATTQVCNTTDIEYVVYYI